MASGVESRSPQPAARRARETQTVASFADMNERDTAPGRWEKSRARFLFGAALLEVGSWGLRGGQPGRGEGTRHSGETIMEDLRLNVRLALRTLRRNPLISFLAVLCLALGIGANTAIFSVVNTVLLRPLPFRDVERL